MAQAGKPGGGVSGKPGGGMGGLGGGSTPMTAEQAAAANGTRNQNLYTTVSGLSRPGAAARPSGPAGPPQPTPRPAGPAIDRAPPPGGPQPRPTLDPSLLTPLINGTPANYPTNAAESFAAPATTQLGSTAGVDYDPMTGRPIPKRRGRGDASYGKM